MDGPDGYMNMWSRGKGEKMKAIKELESQIIRLDWNKDVKLNYVKRLRSDLEKAKKEYKALCDEKRECKEAIEQLKGVKSPAIFAGEILNRRK